MRLSNRLRGWRWVGLWMVVVYSTLYIIRPISAFFRNNIPHYGIFVNTIVILLTLEAAAILYAVYKSGFFKKRYTFSLLLISLTLYAVLILKVRLAEEKIHFIEYGLLGFLVYRALVVDVRGWRVYILSIAVVIILGWVDEGIQYFLPNRVYDIRDVVMNGVGGLISLVFIFIVDSDGPRT